MDRDTVRGTQVSEGESGTKIASHRQSIVVISGPDRGARREIRSSRVTIGTAAENKLVLTDPTVSRHHCEIEALPGRYLIRDLESTNGTRVNGVAVFEAELPPNARIRVGDTELRFEPKHKWERVKPLDDRSFGGLDGASPQMRLLFGALAKVAETDLSCVIVGETGTGKEVAARSLHAASARASHPFVTVDCAALTEQLAPAELFGHERGAFTDALVARPGVFEAAHGGTLFFDDIGELPPAVQPQLLRALQQRTVKRLGASDPAEFDARILASSKVPPGELVRAGRLREDLHHRWTEIVLTIPPLRERSEDIPILARALADEVPRDGVAAASIADDALAWLAAQPWPGNVRQLRNLLRRAIAFADGPALSMAELDGALALDPALDDALGVEGPGGAALSELVGEGLVLPIARQRWNDALEQAFLVRLVRRSMGDLDRAAELAGIHKKSLQRLLRRHRIEIAGS